MNRMLNALGMFCCALGITGCSQGKSETFTFTAELSPNVYYRADAVYGADWGDQGGDSAGVAIREELPIEYKEDFNDAGVSAFYGQCQWLFRTSGPKRRIVKILDCKDTDAKGELTRGRPVAGYTLDQLPGKTVKMKIKLLEEERPFVGDTWVKVPNGWKRCMGKGFEDQYAFCRGNYKDFSSFIMTGSKQCTIYPGCTE